MRCENRSLGPKSGDSVLECFSSMSPFSSLGKEGIGIRRLRGVRSQKSQRKNITPTKKPVAEITAIAETGRWS